MAKKKHCDKHYRFVATCPECQALNELDDDSERRLYPDVTDPDDLEGASTSRPNPPSNRPPQSPEIPNMNTYGRNPRPSAPNRFTYTRPPSHNPKRSKMISLIVVLTIILIIGIYGIPLWHARINLQNQLYAAKSNIDFWQIYTLNGWSTNFFFNKVGLLGALIGSVVMSIPPDSTFIRLIAAKLGRREPSKKAALLFWWTIGFAFFFIIGQTIDSGYFSLAMQMTSDGSLQASYWGAFQVLSDPSQVSMEEMFAYSNIFQPIVNYLIGLIIFRLILNILSNSYMRKNTYKSLSNIFFIISIAFILGLLGMVEQALDKIDLTRVYSVWIGIFAFFILGIIALVASSKNDGTAEIILTDNAKRKSAITAAAMLIIILIPVFSAIPMEIGKTNVDVWTETIWDVQISREIEWTRQTSGIQLSSGLGFDRLELANYTEDVQTDDLDIRDNIRQYDKIASGSQMIKYITSPSETMADSDIVYVSGVGEFWVAPRTLNMDKVTESAVNQHTEIYDHVDGFLALDTSTGEILNSEDYESIFGVDSRYPIYFGEKEDTSYLTSTTDDYYSDFYLTGMNAFENDILLGTNWTSGTYNVSADGTISGLEAFWYTIQMGLTSSALDGGDKAYIINRNIRDRVGAVLLPGMVIDDDPYLIFNTGEGLMYYGVSIYTEIAMNSYAQSPIYRFLGLVLIDVKSGELNWYKNPALPVPADDSLYNLWRIYIDQYPWQECEDWLIEQMRYPETLWEKQLEIDYTYHVDNPTDWKRGDKFYEIPDGGDTFYIETDLGEGLEFVGINIVKYETADVQKLAGIYVIRQGEHFGETIFYGADTTENVIGPQTAKSQFNTKATQEINLIEDARFGNTLLYPLAGSLYYYIPVYAQSEDYQNLVLAGLVNAYNQEAIYWGEDIVDAYAALALDQLNETETNITETEDIELTFDVADSITYDPAVWAEMRVILEYVNSSALYQRNLTLNITIRSDQYMNVSLFGTEKVGYIFNLTSTIEAYNYTINTPGMLDLYPGEGRILTVKFNPSESFSAPSLVIGFKIEVIDDDSGEVILSSGWEDFSFVNPA